MPVMKVTTEQVNTVPRDSAMTAAARKIKSARDQLRLIVNANMVLPQLHQMSALTLTSVMTNTIVLQKLSALTLREAITAVVKRDSSAMEILV